MRARPARVARILAGLPPEARADLERGQAIIDTTMEEFGFLPSDVPVEIRVATEIHLYLSELDWLDDGETEFLGDIIRECAPEHGDFYSEEEGSNYAFYCTGFDLRPLSNLLRAVLWKRLGKQKGDEYEVSVEDLPEWLGVGKQLRIARVS